MFEKKNDSLQKKGGIGGSPQRGKEMKEVFLVPFFKKEQPKTWFSQKKILLLPCYRNRNKKQ